MGTGPKSAGTFIAEEFATAVVVVVFVVFVWHVSDEELE